MPGYDGTGPLGTGPMTGRGKGYCVMELPENEKLQNIVSEVLSELRDPTSTDNLMDETAQLNIRVRQMKSALINLDHRIEILKKKQRNKFA